MNGRCSSRFYTFRGVRQGPVLSPHLLWSHAKFYLVCSKLGNWNVWKYKARNSCCSSLQLKGPYVLMEVVKILFDFVRVLGLKDYQGKKTQIIWLVSKKNSPKNTCWFKLFADTQEWVNSRRSFLYRFRLHWNLKFGGKLLKNKKTIAFNGRNGNFNLLA